MNLQGIAGMEPVALAWGEAVWRACWQGGIFLLAVWSLCRLLPRLPAALQCWLWWLACLKLVLGLVALPPISLPLLAASGPARAISSPAYAPVPFLPASGGTMSAGAAPSAGWWLLPALLWSAGVLLCLLVIARQSLALCALRREATSLADSQGKRTMGFFDLIVKGCLAQNEIRCVCPGQTVPSAPRRAAWSRAR